MINRKEILNILSDRFVSDQDLEWVEVKVISTLLHLNIVSYAFADIGFQERTQYVESLFNMPVPFTKGFWNLVTPDEAVLIGLEKPVEESSARINSWSDLANSYKNQLEITAELTTHDDQTRVISFYSYKGGVGRTTAIAHVAYLLAARGKKVVIVDLDIEAPGFLNIFDKRLYDEPKHGLIDYFYDRIIKTEDMEKEVLITDIFTELRFSDIAGRLFMVPAGKMNIDYIERSDFIKAKLVSGNRKDYWAEFTSELTAQLNLDYILIDTRTGINEWGAFSLLMISDSSYFFIYPNEENYLGTKTILEAMNEVGYRNYTIIFSKVPAIKEGKDKMNKYWNGILSSISTGDSSMRLTEPISISYSTDLALADGYPSDLKDMFIPIVELILEDEKAETIKSILGNFDLSVIVDSLKATLHDESGLPENFLKPMFLQKFFGDEVSIVLSQKRAGKTTLGKMIIDYIDQLGIKEQVIPIWAYLPERDMNILNTIFTQQKSPGVIVWVANILKNVYLQRDKSPFIQQYLNTLSANIIPLNSGGEFLEGLIENENMAEKSANVIKAWELLHEQISESNVKLWLLFDDLLATLNYNQAIKELLKVVISNRLCALGFKIFFDKNDWIQLNFAEKERFKGKIIELLWNKHDFVSIIVDYVFQSCELGIFYKEIGFESSGIELNESIRQTLLQTLWGLRIRETKYSKKMTDWIYEMLSDAQQGTYPETIKKFLQGALDYEREHVSRSKSSILSFEAVKNGLHLASKDRWELIVRSYPEVHDVLERMLQINKTGVFKASEFYGLFDERLKAVEVLKVLESLMVGSWSEVYNGEPQLTFSGLYRGIFCFGNKNGF